jgi:hypothetical protein
MFNYSFLFLNYLIIKLTAEILKKIKILAILIYRVTLNFEIQYVKNEIKETVFILNNIQSIH